MEDLLWKKNASRDGTHFHGRSFFMPNGISYVIMSGVKLHKKAQANALISDRSGDNKA